MSNDNIGIDIVKNCSSNNMEERTSISSIEHMTYIPQGGCLTPISRQQQSQPSAELPIVKLGKIDSKLRFTLSPTYTPPPHNDPFALSKIIQPDIVHKSIKTSDSGEEFKNPKVLLAKYRSESLLLAEIHIKSSEYCQQRNQFCTLFALSITLLCSVLDPILQKYAEDVQKIFTTASFAFIGGINVMFNFLAYQQKAELHKQARDSHRQIVDIIEMTFAQATDEKPYDYGKVLTEIRQIHTNLTKIAPTIPPPIAHKYEGILCPSLLKRELKDQKKLNFAKGE